MLRGRRQELHAGIAKALEEQVAPPSGEEASVGERAALLAHHWLRAEEWEKALDYTLEAAERARKLYARPEAISHYWQALELLERLPHTSERSRVHATSFCRSFSFRAGCGMRRRRRACFAMLIRR